MRTWTPKAGEQNTFRLPVCYTDSQRSHTLRGAHAFLPGPDTPGGPAEGVSEGMPPGRRSGFRKSPLESGELGGERAQLEAARPDEELLEQFKQNGRG